MHTMISLSARLRCSIKLRLAMLELKVPDKPLFCSSNLVVELESLQLTPYHKQWLMYGSIQWVELAHSFPLAESKKIFSAFLSTGQKRTFSLRSNPGKKHNSNGAGVCLRIFYESCGEKELITTSRDTYTHISGLLLKYTNAPSREDSSSGIDPDNLLPDKSRISRTPS